MSPGGRNKRQPDAGIHDAIQQVLKNQKFKRMMVFGLRSLSDLCVPPSIKYKENSLATLESDAFDALIKASDNFKGDDEVLLLIGRVFFGVSDALKEESKSVLTSAEQHGFSSCVMRTVAGGLKDEQALKVYLDTLKNLKDLGVTLDSVEMVPGLVAALNPNLKAPMVARLLESIAEVSKNKSAAASLGDADVLSKVFNSLSKIDASTPDGVSAITYGLQVAGNVAAAEKARPGNLDSVITLMDRCKDKQVVQNAGSAALAKMVSPDELKRCLNTLKAAAPNSPERANALTTLASMSYISSCADQIVQTGGVPLLCEAVLHSSQQIAGGSADVKVNKGLIGASKMLATVARGPHRHQVVEAGGLKALMAALQAGQKNANIAAVALSALEPIVAVEADAQTAAKANLFKLVADAMNSNPSASDVQIEACSLLASAITESTASAAVEAGVIPSITRAMKQSNLKSNVVCQRNALQALQALASAIKDYKLFAECVDNASEFITAHAQTAEVATSGVDLLHALATAPGGAPAMTGGPGVDAVLSVMLAHADANNGIPERARDTLAMLATEKDVARTLSSLEQAVNNARMQPAKCLRALAAVNGLNQIARLGVIFEEKNASGILIKAINNWIEGSKFNDQMKIIKAGCQGVASIAKRSSAPVDQTVKSLLQTLQSPGLRTLAEKQNDPTDNTLTHIATLMEEVVATRRVTAGDTTGQIVEEILRVMRKYPDSRRVQVCCIKALNHLACESDENVRKVVESGAMRSVIAYMQKVAMYDDVALGGSQLLLTLGQSSPRVLDNLRAADALGAIKAVASAHTGRAEIRKNCTALMALLIPEGDMERVIHENMREAEMAIKGGDWNKLTQALNNINQVTLNPDSAKVAARCDVGRCMDQVLKALKGVRPDDAAPVYNELGHMAQNLTQKRIGCANLAKYSGIKGLIDVFENLKNHKQFDSGTAAALVASRRLLQKDRNSTQIAQKENLITRVCLLARQRDDHDSLFAGAAGVVAAMKNQREVVKNEDYRRFIGEICRKLLEDGPKEKKWPLVEALDEMLLDPNEDLIELIVKNKGLGALFKVMDDFPDDPGLVRRAQRCIDNINRFRNLRVCLRKIPDSPPLPTVGKVTKRVMRAQMHEPNVCANALNILNKCFDKAEAHELSEINLLPEIEELTAMHPRNELLAKACGEYLGKLGTDEFLRNYMREICELYDNKPADWLKLMPQLCNKLALYLLGDVKDEASAFKMTQPCMDKLADAIKKNPEPQLLPSVARVTRRLARRFRDQPNSPYGVKALIPQMMPTLVELLAKDATNINLRPRNFLIDAFSTLADCARHPEGRKQLYDQVMRAKLLPVCADLLKQYENDPEVCAAILDFLGQFASIPNGADTIMDEMNRLPAGRRLGSGDFPNDIMALMKRHRMDPELVDNALELLGNLGQNCKTFPMTLAQPAFAKALDDAAASNGEALVAVMKCHKKLVGKEDRDATIMALKKAIDQYHNLLADDTVPPEVKAMAGAELSEFMAVCAEHGLSPEVNKAGGLQELIDMFENHKKDLPTMIRVIAAKKKICNNDADAKAKLLHNGLKIMLDEAGPELAGDPVACQETLDLLKVLMEGEGNARAVADMEEFKKFMTDVELAAANFDPADQAEIQALAESIKRMIADDQPRVLTLEEVFNKWSAGKTQGEILSIAESALVLQYWDFCSDYTEEYSKEPHSDPSSALGKEWMYGCKCYQLLHELPENTQPCIDKNNENVYMLKAMAKQRNDHCCQYPTEVAADALKHADAIPVWAATPNAAAIAAEVLNRGRKISGVSNEERESMIIPRMQVVERLAINRTYFNGTDCMAALIGLWDDYDDGKYSVELLKQVFKSMRKIVNDHWVGIILKNNVPERLIAVVADKTARIDLLPDVLFLLAALAVVPEIKTMIGELKGVEECLDLLQRSLKNPVEGVAAVETNDCLALSAITLGHGANLQRFVANKGLELNIQAMDAAMADGNKLEYDVANAASLLMCNTCFKRDEMKEMYGKKGACQAVMRTINRYDGSEDERAFRCLGTMFKAIGNLALYTPNVTIFMDGQIEKTFAHLYGKSERLPDTLIEASLRTLSNLAMENTEANMTRFGVCLAPILFMLKQGQRTSTTMFTLAFDVLGALCRLPTNSRNFLKEDGIPTCLKILNSHSDKYLYANGIHVLGIQTTNPSSVDELIKHGVFDFLTSLLEAENNSEDDESMNVDLAISGLRCIRRLLKSQHAAKCCINAGALNQIGVMMHKPAEHSMLHMECHRVVLNLLTLFPPPPPPPPQPAARKGDDGWDDEVADEGVLPSAESMDRPPSPRSWEAIELDETQICSMIEACCKLLLREENAKQTRMLRTTLGLLGYFACEKIPNTVHSYYSGNIGTGLAGVFKANEKDGDLCKAGCHIINNVAFVSEPDLYVTLRKEKEMRKALDLAVQQIGGAGGARSFCDLTLKLLNERSADPQRFEITVTWDYPMELTWWDKDKYPNGVQDLPVEMKEELRTGGKFKTVTAEGNKEILHWKSSMDLLLLNWRIDPKEGPWQHSVAISRICAINRGLASNTLRQAHENGSPTSRPREGECLVLQGPPTDDFPSGVEINLLCGMKRSRDKAYELFSEWREAAAFGF
eukprot:Blabericola_migrator_1__12967@NODE_85_length_14814_cov_131_925612_g76_i0_p1_GENE_NODE_85_length_14814_cov_131_925612_g76_i0NODE_85_length_14814_cov_131_925612_g76_i0_p1_ORF_typecomplete_len2624_score585_46Arm_2/PF04826_13/13Arm_2/PF04826_13/13Arm_2/PF04826_13/0_17Arm_2/PF04826_13/0_13Arm_2/PF04826_13/20Arm_2/PF04826_13/2_4e02Arm_2/PF04826_13/1_1e03Arm_2/PF04826_13/1Arm_2/PF04826_13/5_6e05KAP/PF05804_12/9_8e02KAP/PF05804_12/0_005KAP/PF05804_12/34KAP/PF05804_12/35KAP/PF05804_12/3_4e02KAP/PF05804_1